MKVALFLGAGASAVFGKPTTVELKDRLLKKYLSNSLHDQVLRALLSVEKFQDIEYVLSAIEDLFEFSKTLGHEFFLDMIKRYGSHQMIGFSGTGYTYSSIMDELKRVRDTIQEEVFTNYTWKHENLEDANLIAVHDLIFSIYDNPSDEIHVFTTNYDQVIETYCAKKRNLLCIDGFQHDLVSGKTKWAKGDYGYHGIRNEIRNVHLYKLHGSLDWKKHIIDGFIKTGEEAISPDPKITESILIYPTLSPKNGKNNEPYRTILGKFDEYMQKADACIVIGFSFRDEHVQKIFEKFYNRGKKILVVSPTAISNFRIEIMKEHPSEEQLKSWEGESTSQNIKNQIYLIQKRLEIDTVNDIVKEIKRRLLPDLLPDNPTIPKGKSDRYYKCGGCGTNVSVQYKNCPSCNTTNPDPQFL